MADKENTAIKNSELLEVRAAIKALSGENKDLSPKGFTMALDVSWKFARNLDKASRALETHDRLLKEVQDGFTQESGAIDKKIKADPSRTEELEKERRAKFSEANTKAESLADQEVEDFVPQLIEEAVFDEIEPVIPPAILQRLFPIVKFKTP